MKQLIWSLIILFFCFTIPVGCSDPNQESEKLLNHATQLLADGFEAENESYSEAYDLYADALDEIETLINEYPSSYLAAAIPQEEIHIGEYSYSQIKENLVPISRLKAASEIDPLSCSALIYCELEDSVDKDYFFMELTKLYAKSGRYDEATDLAAIIDEPYYKIASLCEISSRVLDSGDTYKGLGLISEAYNLALHSIKDNDEKVESLANIGCMYAKAKEHKKASKAFKQAEYIPKRIISGRDKTVISLAKISSKYIEASRYDGGYYMGAIRLVKETDRDPFVLILKEESEIRGFIKSGKYDDAFALIPSLEEKLESIVDSEIRDMCTAKLAAIYAELNELNQAEQFISLIEDEFEKDKALANIAGHHAGFGQLGKALEVVNTIQDLAYKASALIQIATRQPNYMQMVDEHEIGLLHTIVTDVSSENPPSCDMSIFDHFAGLSPTKEGQVSASIRIGDSQERARGLAQTPEEAVKRVYGYAISGDVDSIKPYLIATEYILRSDPEQLRKSFIGYHGDKLLGVEILFSKQTDHTAQVWVDFLYEHRKETASKPIELRYKDGGWKIVYP